MTTALLTTSEAAAALRMTRRWVAIKCHAGRLRGIRYGRAWRIPADAVDQYLADHSNIPEPVAVRPRKTRNAS